MKLIDYRLMRVMSELHKSLRDKYVTESGMVELDADMVKDLNELVAKIEAIKNKIQE